jgi:hypothetical protein
MLKKIYSHLSLAFLFLLNPHPAFATLGEPADSVAADRNALSAKEMKMKRHSKYSIHEFESDSATIREFISPNGIVFGIAWSGLTHPDLTQLLGKYAPQYKTKMQASPRMKGSRNQAVRGSDVVVEKWGHMRNLQGHAFAPSLVPAGVSPNEIQ